MRTNAPADLWKRVAVGASDDCWPFLGCSMPNGYGTFWVAGRPRSTHRLAYELTNGPIPHGLMVLHGCDNKICCNPAHLHVGTGSDNIREAWERGRIPSRDGELHPLSKLTNADRREIVRRRTSGENAGRLAEEFSVSPPTITRLMHERDRWQEAAA